jgi:hypothetical protein
MSSGAVSVRVVGLAAVPAIVLALPGRGAKGPPEANPLLAKAAEALIDDRGLGDVVSVVCER